MPSLEWLKPLAQVFSSHDSSNSRTVTQHKTLLQTGTLIINNLTSQLAACSEVQQILTTNYISYLPVTVFNSAWNLATMSSKHLTPTTFTHSTPYYWPYSELINTEQNLTNLLLSGEKSTFSLQARQKSMLPKTLSKGSVQDKSELKLSPTFL